MPKSGKYYVFKADGEKFIVDGEEFAARFEKEFPNARDGKIPTVRLLQWAPGKKMAKPLSSWLKHMLRGKTMVSVAWAETDQFRVYTFAKPCPGERVTKKVGGDVATGRLWARLNEVWYGPGWRYI